MHTQHNPNIATDDDIKLYGFNDAKSKAQLAFEEAYAICNLFKVKNTVNKPSQVFAMLGIQDNQFVWPILGMDKARFFNQFFTEQRNDRVSHELKIFIYKGERYEIFFRPPFYKKNDKKYWEDYVASFKEIEKAVSNFCYQKNTITLEDARYYFLELIKEIKSLNLDIDRLPENDFLKKVLPKKMREWITWKGLDLTKISELKDSNQEMDLNQEIDARLGKNNKDLFKNIKNFIERRVKLIRLKHLIEYKQSFPDIYFDCERVFKSLAFYKRLFAFLPEAMKVIATPLETSVLEIPKKWDKQIDEYQSYRRGYAPFKLINASSSTLTELQDMVKQLEKHFNQLKPEPHLMVFNYACVLINFHFFEVAFLRLDPNIVVMDSIREKLFSLLDADEIKYFFGLSPLEDVVALLKKPGVSWRLKNLNECIRELFEFCKRYEFLSLEYNRYFSVTNEGIEARLSAISPMEQTSLSNQDGNNGLAAISDPLNLDTTITTQEATSDEPYEPMQEERVDWELVAQNTTEANNQQNKRQKRSKVIDLIKIVTELQFDPRGNRTLDAAVKAALDLTVNTLLQAGSSYYAADEAIDSAYLEKVTVIVQNRIRKYRMDSHYENDGFSKRSEPKDEKEPRERNEIETTNLTRDRLNEVFKRIAPKQIAYDHGPLVTTRPPSAQPENKPLSHARVDVGVSHFGVNYFYGSEREKPDPVLRRILAEGNDVGVKQKKRPAAGPTLFPAKPKHELFIEKGGQYKLFGSMLKNRINQQSMISDEILKNYDLEIDDLQKAFEKLELQCKCLHNETEKKIQIISENPNDWEIVKQKFQEKWAEQKKALEGIGFTTVRKN